MFSGSTDLVQSHCSLLLFSAAESYSSYSARYSKELVETKAVDPRRSHWQIQIEKNYFWTRYNDLKTHLSCMFPLHYGLLEFNTVLFLSWITICGYTSGFWLISFQILPPSCSSHTGFKLCIKNTLHNSSPWKQTPSKATRERQFPLQERLDPSYLR